MAANMRPKITIASNSRSTTSDASDAVNGTSGADRESAKARASSPTRAGTTLLIIIPIAVARHSCPNGRFGATGSRIGRQRIARSGNTPVARIAARTMQPHVRAAHVGRDLVEPDPPEREVQKARAEQDPDDPAPSESSSA